MDLVALDWRVASLGRWLSWSWYLRGRKAKIHFSRGQVLSRTAWLRKERHHGSVNQFVVSVPSMLRINPNQLHEYPA
jgi:hypothetical protein